MNTLLRRGGARGLRQTRTARNCTSLNAGASTPLALQRRCFSEYQPVNRSLLGAGSSPAIVSSVSPKQVIEPEEITEYPVAQVTTLPSGLRVATETSPRFTHTATVAVFIEAGSRHETRDNNGTAHFLEHLAFKGTQRRDKDQLEVEVESLGGSLNAYTSREQTAYIASCGKEDIPQFVDILSDVLLNSKFTSSGVDRERSTILREMEEVYKEKEEYVMDQLHDTAFLEHPLGQTILGPVENIRKITREDLLRFIATHYTTDRMVVCAVGAVDHGEFVKLVEEKFAALPRKPAYPYERVPAKFTGSDYTEDQDDMEMGAAAIAYPTCGWTHPDTSALQFMNGLLGTWTAEQAGGENSSSLMVTEFAGKRLGTKIMSATSLYRDIGLFTVYFEFYEKRASHACWVVAQALRSLHLHLTPDQVDDVRNQLTANIFSHLDTTQMICDELGRHLLCYGRRIHPTEQVARLNAVTCDEIKRVAHKYMWDKEHALAMVGPIFEAKHFHDYAWWKRKTYGVFH